MANGKSSLLSSVKFIVAIAVCLATVFAPIGSAWAAPAFVGSAVRPGADGYWLVSSDGAVSANGNARFLGDMSSGRLNRPIVGMASTPSGNGYWLVAGDGGIFSFGDARFFGSTGAMSLNKPVVGMASTPSARGYWMVASDGGIFAFGDAPFYGSTGAMSLNQPIVGMSPTHDGTGYWMVASDGGIFAFGSAGFFGSTGSMKLNQPVASMSTSPTGKGYWLAAADGGIFAFGDAPFLGAGVDGSGARTIALVRDVFGGYTIVSSNGRAAHKAAPVTSPRPTAPIVVTPPTTTPTVTTPTVPVTTSPPVPPTSIPTTVPVTTVPVTSAPPSTAPPASPTSFRVSFQPQGATVPSGYTADYGNAYNGNLGWFDSSGNPASLVGNARERNAVPDQRADTFIHMQLPSSTTGSHIDGTWEHRVANGTYDVLVGAGDPSYSDSRHVVNVEGIRTIDFTPAGSNTHSTKVRVVVNDGKLTVDANGGANTKLAYIEAGPASGPAPVVQLAPTTAPPVTTPPVTTPPVTAPPVSGSPVGPWQLVFDDGFDTNVGEGGFLRSYGSKWSAYPWGWLDTSKRGNYNPNIISVDNGMMNMRLHTTPDGKHHVAAPEPKLPGGSSQLYGRYEVRFRADAVAGYKTAWLLWPKSEVWPRDGEIDFPEGNLTGSIHAFMHRQNGTSGGDQDAFSTNARYTDWHTAILEWMPGRVNFILDGKTIGSSTSRIPNTPMRWVLQTETILDGVVPNNTSGNVQIDYVKVWKYTG